METWKNIIDYYGLYQVSSCGNIKSLPKKNRNNRGEYISKEILLKPLINKKNGYSYVSLYKNKKQTSFSIHRLVAKAFLPNPENKTDVNHINSNRTDNRVENLEWATRSENNIHAYKHGNMYPMCLGKFGYDHHRSKAVNQMSIDGIIINTFGSQREAGRITGTNQRHISSCCIGKRKTSNGFMWSYV